MGHADEVREEKRGSNWDWSREAVAAQSLQTILHPLPGISIQLTGDVKVLLPETMKNSRQAQEMLLSLIDLIQWPDSVWQQRVFEFALLQSVQNDHKIVYCYICKWRVSRVGGIKPSPSLELLPQSRSQFFCSCFHSQITDLSSNPGIPVSYIVCPCKEA